MSLGRTNGAHAARLSAQRHRKMVAVSCELLVSGLLVVAGCGKKETAPPAKDKGDKAAVTKPEGTVTPKVPQEAKAAPAADAGMPTREEIAAQVTELYGSLGDNPVDLIEMSRKHGMWRITFATRGRPEAPSTLFVTTDGKVAFEGGFEIQREREGLQMDAMFAGCLAENGVKLIGDSRDRNVQAQLRVIGRFSGQIFEDCGRTKGGCEAIAAKMKVKLPVLTKGDRVEKVPHTRPWLETLTGCK